MVKSRSGYRPQTSSSLQTNFGSFNSTFNTQDQNTIQSNFTSVKVKKLLYLKYLLIIKINIFMITLVFLEYNLSVYIF